MEEGGRTAVREAGGGQGETGTGGWEQAGTGTGQMRKRRDLLPHSFFLSLTSLTLTIHNKTTCAIY